MDIVDNPDSLELVVHPATRNREHAERHGTAVSG
jgi:hypothetical protein